MMYCTFDISAVVVFNIYQSAIQPFLFHYSSVDIQNELMLYSALVNINKSYVLIKNEGSEIMKKVSFIITNKAINI